MQIPTSSASGTYNRTLVASDVTSEIEAVLLRKFALIALSSVLVQHIGETERVQEISGSEAHKDLPAAADTDNPQETNLSTVNSHFAAVERENCTESVQNGSA
jgi:hypothetical protein